MAGREKRGQVSRLEPKLRMIANGGRTVNHIRSERSAAVKVREPDPSLALQRGPRSSPVPSDLLELVPRKTWEAPARAEDDVLVDVRKRSQIEQAFDAAREHDADALIVQLGSLGAAQRQSVVELAARHRLPAIYPSRQYVDAGGLVSYGMDSAQLFYRAAAFVERLAKEGVLVLPGSTCGSPGHFRISLTGTAEMIDRSLPVFRAAI